MRNHTDDNPNTVIESIGIYLPPNSFSTSEILEGCSKPFRFPLEKISGIRYRPVAGEHEFSIDLARKAVADCLEKSKHSASDIDLLICCNISRYDGPEAHSFEPSTSVKLRKHFGFERALVFDITNACAGMFTGIYIVDALLNSGAIRCGMVVSGEYITHLTRTAQREIDGFMDNRLACLTLGDSGAAVILEKGPDHQTGFQRLDLQTFGRYSPFCIAKVAETGGWIMYTDSVNLADAAIKSGAKYALDVLNRAGWSPEALQYLIMHQTSRMTMESARREINHLLENQCFHGDNTVDNLEQRGNTASTSHFVAIADQIDNDQIQSGDKVAFSVSASGLTVGLALYVFDDLPDRLRQMKSQPYSRNKMPAAERTSSASKITTPGIRIESLGTIPEKKIAAPDSMDLLKEATAGCFEHSIYQPDDIELLMYCGVYRTGYVLEPAYATLLAGALDMNATLSEPNEKRTFAFDVFNGSLGFLNACYIAQQVIAAGKCQTAMIAAAEIENNAESFPHERLGIQETASAVILDRHPAEGKGFSRFLFRCREELIDAYETYCDTSQVNPHLRIRKDTNLEKAYIELILPAVQDLLEMEGLELDQVDVVLPPQISSAFIARLSESLGLPRAKFMDVVGEGTDLFTSSLVYALKHAYETEFVKPGDKGLIIAVGSGIQVGCVIYQF